MVLVIHPSVEKSIKRDWDDGGYWENSAGGARWAFFAIFIVLIIIVILGTIRVNKKRTQHGQQPIYGTRWMTPPSYRQSQTQYQQPSPLDPDLPSAYVPTYFATANENDYDMGYYDSRGIFHANPNAKSMVQHPPEVHTRNESVGGAAAATTVDADGAAYLSRNLGSPGDGNDSDEDIDNITRPRGPPPRRSTTQLSETNIMSGNETGRDQVNNIAVVSANVSDHSYQPPDGRPPVSSSLKSNDTFEKTVDLRHSE
ncbi:hypothetical protein KGF56_000924 [Candida oxycetoniae]|uniref:Protein RCR2 n=1 Tax=Candida oxycetoniae TaxID=497107 RepID=A0AAI9WZD4_9ASCO|nr:uncharacterized protein KGF56_000924 [Candida oxycetoniae]KAI3406083.2 hypothetical protein KGF56_000924 [Candida oxycetoniae]